MVLANRLRLTPPRRESPPEEEEEPRRDMEECGDVIKQVGALWQIDIVLQSLLIFNDERLHLLLLFFDGDGMIIILWLLVFVSWTS